MEHASVPPKAVIWFGRLGIIALLALPLSILAVRAGFWQQGLAVYAVSCLAAALLLLVLIVLFALPRFSAWRGAIAGRGLYLLPGCLALLSLLTTSGDIPPIHDITTDINDPPAFTAAQAQRGPDSNTLTLTEDTLSQQRSAYPDLQPIPLGLAPAEAFQKALGVAEEMGWKVYHQDGNSGSIEAVATTAIMAFKDDIVIRLRPSAGGTVMDLRSVSRVGVSDLGANAARIRAFQAHFQP